MKHELPCAVVRDLLPSYIEGLTEAQTTAAVKDHLESCADCRNRYEAMTGGETMPVSQEKEVDYLKTVRRKSGNKMILAVLLAVVLVLAGVGTKLFWIGTPCDGSSVAIEAALSADETQLLVTLDEMNSGSAIQGLKVETEEGIIRITGREVLSSPFRSNRPDTVTLSLEGIQTVEVFGRTVWQDGLLIDLHTSRLLGYKVPFVGNAPDVNRLISNMDLDASHTLELHTDQPPYGVTIHFSQAIEANRRFMVEGNAYLLLALVDNLEEIYWDDPSGYSDSLTLSQANAALAGLMEDYNALHGTTLLPQTSVKDYGTSAHNLQLLRNFLGV